MLIPGSRSAIWTRNQLSRVMALPAVASLFYRRTASVPDDSLGARRRAHLLHTAR